MKFCPETGDAEAELVEVVCTRCCGSGEGWHADQRCARCGGSGIEPDKTPEQEPYPRLCDE